MGSSFSGFNSAFTLILKYFRQTLVDELTYTEDKPQRTYTTKTSFTLREY